jgi:hypothetical protein
MSRFIAVVEGQTEQGFLRDVLAPWLGARGIYLTARLVGKPGHKGGVGEYQRSRRDMLLLLKQEKETVVTTMFDFYGMPDSWPGRSQAKKAAFPKKARTVEEAVRKDIATELGSSFDESRFIPYVQMHEFEALLFSHPPTICEVLLSPDSEEAMQQIRADFSTPEEINDGANTAPSKRLLNLFAEYRKRLHGLIAAKRIGVETMQAECPHFAEWLSTLEALGSREGD